MWRRILSICIVNRLVHYGLASLGLLLSLLMALVLTILENNGLLNHLNIVCHKIFVVTHLWQHLPESVLQKRINLSCCIEFESSIRHLFTILETDTAKSLFD